MGRTLHEGPLTDEQRDLAAQNFPLARWLTSYWLRRYPFWEDEIRDEIHSAAHMGLVKAARSYHKDLGTFATYARKCIVTEFYDVVKSCERLRRSREQYLIRFPVPAYCEHEPPDELPIAWILALPERERKAILLRYGCEMPTDEIARNLKCSVRYVNMLVCQGMETLRSRALNDN